MKFNERKIVIVAGMHGNERKPVNALSDAGINFILANPRAFRKNVRFTEKDINAAFGTRRRDFESKRAGEILKQIKKRDVVIDFHTSSDYIPFAILVDRKMLPLAEMTGLKRAVIMKHNIKKGHALINYRDGISVEAGPHKDNKSYVNTLNIIKNIKSGRRRKISVYEVYDIIRQPGKYTNFRRHPGGYIPILANEPEYERDGIYGLKARKS